MKKFSINRDQKYGDNVIELPIRKEESTLSLAVGRITSSLFPSISNEDEDTIVNKRQVAIYRIQNKLDLRYFQAYYKNPVVTVLNVENIPDDKLDDWLELTRNIINGYGELKRVGTKTFAIIPSDVVYTEKVNRLK